MTDHRAHRAFSVRELVYIALFAALLSVCAWIAIPAAVPFTMQTFGVFLTMRLLGGRRGAVAILAYLLLGAVGVPVFSGFRGGPGVLVGATGGYLTGFLCIGPVCTGIKKLFPAKKWALPAGLVLGLLLCYAFGTAWFMAVMARASGAMTLGSALSMCVLPFLLPDAVKLALALLLGNRLAPLLKLD